MLKDFTAVRSAMWVAAVAIVYGNARVSYADHSANIQVVHDAFLPVYTGTSHPAGNLDVNVVAPAPGYFNGMSGGSDLGANSFGGAYGEVGITPAPFGQTQLTALAIHVTDAAGASHSLSTLNDPALADIINDPSAPLIRSPQPRPSTPRRLRPSRPVKHSTAASPSTSWLCSLLPTRPAATSHGTSTSKTKSATSTASPPSASPTSAA